MSFKKISFLFFCFSLNLSITWGQNKKVTFFIPSDTLNLKRKNTVIIAQTSLASVALVGLNKLWYADYPQSSFHFINDNSEWLQMDKIGHFYSSYHLGRLGSETLKWSGENQKKQFIYGSGIGFVFLTAVEVLDGFSSQWGASSGDLIANATGTAWCVSQELLWKEQRITPKFSFHTTLFSKYRPDVLGNSLTENILKDYNGQTYWLSANIHSFAKKSKIPKWLNIALGYGAEGMFSGHVGSNFQNEFLNLERRRQFYLSFDVDFAKIDTKSHFLKTIFSVFNTIKIPAPTLEFTPSQGFKGYLFYF